MAEHSAMKGGDRTHEGNLTKAGKDWRFFLLSVLTRRGLVTEDHLFDMFACLEEKKTGVDK